MANETAVNQQLADQADAAAKIEEVFSAFGNAMVQLDREQQAIRETVTQAITERARVVELVSRLSAQVANISDPLAN